MSRRWLSVIIYHPISWLTRSGEANWRTEETAVRIADQKKSNQKHLNVGSLKPKQKHLMAQTLPGLEGWKPVSSRPSSSWQTSSTSCPTEERPRDTWFKHSIYGTNQISSLIKTFTGWEEWATIDRDPISPSSSPSRQIRRTWSKKVSKIQKFCRW